ncbi:hypothetical protein E2C01_097118 [Portunus trituberculatus]|uniref:Uncharacterized protein n=1 Tax=Portunus trituberculatus TaxID=210409 RepID=A0A5B7K4V4_PORTR|nr:hypothetical protein [Portunus trituberculatus]
MQHKAYYMLPGSLAHCTLLPAPANSTHKTKTCGSVCLIPGLLSSLAATPTQSEKRVGHDGREGKRGGKEK